MDQQSDKATLIELMADIVSAYVRNNSVQQADLPALMADVHKALAGESSALVSEPAAPEQRKLTAQEIKRSITPDHIISFEDGKKYKTLRRSLALQGLTPRDYREKWGLPVDYPVTAPSYSQQRSELAKGLGLGRKREGGLAKVSPEDALRIEAFEEVAESPEGEAGRDDPVLADIAASPEVAQAEGKPKRASKPRVKKDKGNPA
jgi:predicted transcriptional regulator